MNFQLAAAADAAELFPQAVGLYPHMGFVQTGRSDCDGFGHPYPILHPTLSR